MLIANRREESAAATRQLLVDEAARLFSQQGFAKTSLSEIVANVGATKGALYHHFSNKEDLFATCYEQQAARVAAVIRSAESTDDPWLDTLAGCRAFLGCASMPELKAVPIQEAITVLGWQRWRTLDSAHTMWELEQSLERLHEAGILGPFDRQLLAGSIFAILVNAMMALSVSKDRIATEAELMRQLEAFLSGVLS
jgi:TetR/AcrR family transcriptional repressor of tetCD